MEISHLHTWDLTPKDAIELQKQMAGKLVDQVLKLQDIHTVAGVDVSVKDGFSKAAVVVMEFPSMKIIEVQNAVIPTPFPYIPGLLSFREGPALETAFTNLRSPVDVFIFDGMGRIHPRRIGIAAHLGLWLDRPTIGCGKTHFIGDYAEPGNEKGDFSPLIYQGDQLGIVLRTRANVKPVYISPGHRCDIDSAHKVIMACTSGYRLPEPIRAAHQAAGSL